MADILILGAGLGGTIMAFEMREMAREEDNVILVSDRDFFHFVPSNPWVAVGWRRPDDIKVPLAPVCEKADLTFVQGTVSRVDPPNNCIELDDGRTLDYDQLIIATGPRLAFERIEGLGPEHFTQSICHVDHATRSAQAWEAFCDNPGPIVVGAVQGASCFGPAYEFAFIMDRDLRKRRIRDRVPMTFVTSEPYIGHLGLGGVGDSKSMLESELRNRHIDWICNARVDRVEEGVMHVTEVDEEGQDRKQHELPFGYSMLLPSFAGIDAVHDVEGLVNPGGFILIDEHQRNPAWPNIWGIGVAVAIAPKKPTPVPTGVPKTGFMIESMVTTTAHNIRAVLDGAEPKERATWNAVCLADMGDTGIAFVALPQIPPRNVNWMKKGRWVHWAKQAYERYFLRKVRKGISEPLYEKYILRALGIERLRRP